MTMDMSAGADRLRRARIIAILAVTQLIGWGTTNDMLGVLGRTMAADIGIANAVAFLGAGVSLIVSALLSPTVGGWLQRFQSKPVLAGGSVAIASGLIVLGLAHGPIVYFLAWLLLGCGCALGLSAAAYTAIVEREGSKSKQVIGGLMILTGLSSAIFWPILAELNGLIGWRTTLFVMALVHIAVCLPLHLFALPRPMVHSDAAKSSLDVPPLMLTSKERVRVFALVAATTTILSFTGFGLSASLLELLKRAGATPELALQLGSLRGVLAISARLGDMLLGPRSTPVTTSMAACGLILAGTLVLLTLGASPSTLVIFIVLNGLGAGIASLSRVLLPLSFFAVSDYGRQASRLILPQNFANAVAPAIFNACLDHGGVTSVLFMLLILPLAALANVLALAMTERRLKQSTKGATA